VSSVDVNIVISELCVRWNFCLPALEIERFANSPPEDSDEFTEAVLVAES
jgi:hypothetical protein